MLLGIEFVNKPSGLKKTSKQHYFNNNQEVLIFRDYHTENEQKKQMNR